jgi:hypothetical protein
MPGEELSQSLTVLEKLFARHNGPFMRSDALNQSFTKTNRPVSSMDFAARLSSHLNDLADDAMDSVGSPTTSRH